MVMLLVMMAIVLFQHMGMSSALPMHPFSKRRIFSIAMWNQAISMLGLVLSKLL